MKKLYVKVLTLLMFFGLNLSLSAQVPQGFNYMAIARDGSGNILPDHDILVRIAILRTITPLAVEWEEEHSVRTNSTGLFTLMVGDPEAVPVAGGSAASFSEINWINQPLYLRTSIKISSVWTVMGDAQLLSVPYAMVAQSAYSGIGNPFTMNGDTVVITNSVDVINADPVSEDDALFEVKRSDGQTMFAVYNQGVRIYVPLIDGIKGVKGGFAVGGFSEAKGPVFDLFTLNKDSARIYVDKTPDLTKGAKGGFAVGGFSLADKADAIQEYLTITPDSARIRVKDSGKGTKGGFAVSGFSSKSPATSFLNITPENYFIGHESGNKIETAGLYNSILGYQAGKNLSSGGYNTMVGYNAGLNATSGNNNILIGNYAGNDLTSGIHNTLIGNSAGSKHTNQMYNVMIGTSAGSNIIASGAAGSYNTFVGINAGYKTRNSRDNTFIGTNAGYMLEGGNGNTIVGIDAGRGGNDDPTNYYGYTAERNTIIGNMAGRNLKNGSDNVLIGYGAGYGETGNGKMYISNKTSDPPLMYGDFTSAQLGINTKTLGKTLNVGGDLGVTGSITATSLTVSTVTGTLNGPVNGNVNGNVTGNLTGSVSGDINGMWMGRISASETGVLVKDGSERFILSWDREKGTLEITNENEVVPCDFWFKKITKESVIEDSGTVNPKDKLEIITDTNVNGNGFEIHFGQGHIGFCSVWLQFFDGRLSGHYMKF